MSMTLAEIKADVMFQTNNDVEDLDEFEPYIVNYVNAGYEQLVDAYMDKHVGYADGDVIPLSGANDVPELPDYAHYGLVDYATYLVYRNGNSVKQNRGMAFYSSFAELIPKLKYEKNGMRGSRTFINIFSR